MHSQPNVPFDNSYVLLPERFYSRQAPTPVATPGLIRVNHALARQLNIDTEWLESDDALQVFAGNRVPTGAEPIATVYAGHQFGSWNPQLGDGRAVLLGEVVGVDGRRYDIQLKGAGETPYSRMGDGRSPLGPVMREYIISEAMAALGVPSTRSLAAVTTGEKVIRDTLLPGAVLTRVAGSHIRIGTFQYFSARGDHDAVRRLADHVIARHYPEAAAAEKPYLALLEAVIAQQANLLAAWQQLGFIHGVMNTDNMLLSGETIDYGPCAFMDDFRADKVYSSIDVRGRYAYRNQPAIAQWNLAWLAQSLVELLDAEESAAVEAAKTALSTFSAQYLSAYETIMLRKLGLTTANPDNIALIDDLLQRMEQAEADYTLTFRALAEQADTASAGEPGVTDWFEMPEALAPWLETWRARLALEPTAPAERRRMMLAVNPAFIPRNHQVEAAIQAATDNSDFQPFHKLVDALAEPYRYDPALSDYALPPKPEQVVFRTFCGT